MSDKSLHDIANLSINPVWVKADDKLLVPLLERFEKEELGHRVGINTKREFNAEICHNLINFFVKIINEELQNIITLHKRHEQFMRLYGGATSIQDQQQYILRYARDLGATQEQLKQDKKAFKRWFDVDAVADRYHRKIQFSERTIVLCLQRVGPLIGREFESHASVSDYKSVWRKLEVEPLILRLFEYRGDDRVLIAAFHCLSVAIQSLPEGEHESIVDSQTVQFIFRVSLEKNKNIWVQCEALALLETISFDAMLIAIRKCLTQKGHGDDFFVRRRAVVLLADNIANHREMEEYIPAIVKDPSPYVRQALSQNLHKLPPELFVKWVKQLALNDSCKEVRAAATLDFSLALEHPDNFNTVLEVMKSVLKTEHDAYDLRIALKVALNGYQTLDNVCKELADKWLNTLLPLIEDLHLNSPEIPVKRWAAQTSECLWCESTHEAKALMHELIDLSTQMHAGESHKLPDSIFKNHDEEVVGRVLSVMAQNGFGFAVSKGLFSTTITKGNVFKLRLWRLFHELTHPSSDKRQGFDHTVGRIFNGDLRAPSGILAEMSETKVPGEPLFISEEGGYRPYLPLMDDFISSINSTASETKLYTSEGVTIIKAPLNPYTRIKSRFKLIWNFAKYAYMRNWREHSQVEPKKYIDSIRGLGFDITYRPYEDKKPDPTVSRFFAVLPFSTYSEQWEHLKDYFYSAYQNTLSELAIFILFAIAIFFGKHIYDNWKIRKSRRKLPLVIGGWGTRGKSGTERIKCAMFNALGYGFVSKTSGCEAMFLLAHPFGKTHEMFLFRPYDKATIWEQTAVMGYAHDLDTDIFLWECMALNPQYVSLLQHQWTKDDISTITNALPDHEDIQGPAGINIPEVLSEFIPYNKTLITTEEEMLPILSDASKKVGTELHAVSWIDVGLLTPDVLERFPYSEHPANIALVLKLAQKLGIRKDFALKEMADRVMPDLGVLKQFPPAAINTRTLIFINGMSANEQYACLENLKRMNFDKNDPYQDPSEWLSVVVNNRADRVARSKVFAELLVNDVFVDKYFFIGTNLQGIKGFIQVEWDKYAENVTLTAKESESMGGVIEAYAKERRIAYTEKHVKDRLFAMLNGIGISNAYDLVALWDSPEKLEAQIATTDAADHAKIITEFNAHNVSEFKEYNDFIRLALSGESSENALDMQFRKLLEKWFMRRLYFINDSHATGNKINNEIQLQTPPGYTNKIMGMQNIKGTGLDFIYRWLSWETCYKACQGLKSKDEKVVAQSMEDLALFKDYNTLCNEYVRQVMDDIKHTPVAQQEWFQAEIAEALSHLDTAMQEAEKQMVAKPQSGWVAKFLMVIESLLDTDRAMKRRRLADTIYKDLINQRISLQRAAIELQLLNKQQHGGWLLEKISKRFTGV